MIFLQAHQTALTAEIAQGVDRFLQIAREGRASVNLDRREARSRLAKKKLQNGLLRAGQ
jgi:hypothetical protein